MVVEDPPTPCAILWGLVLICFSGSGEPSPHWHSIHGSPSGMETQEAPGVRWPMQHAATAGLQVRRRATRPLARSHFSLHCFPKRAHIPGITQPPSALRGAAGPDRMAGRSEVQRRGGAVCLQTQHYFTAHLACGPVLSGRSRESDLLSWMWLGWACPGCSATYSLLTYVHPQEFIELLLLLVLLALPQVLPPDYPGLAHPCHLLLEASSGLLPPCLWARTHLPLWTGAQ